MLLHRASAVLILQVCAWSIEARSWPSDDDRLERRRGGARGEWGEWSSWTSCSAQCGTGITARTRRCQHLVMLPVDSLLSKGDDSVWCEGDEREMKLCNKQVCTDGRLGFREAECAKYKSSVYSLQGYAWEPFIHPSDPCRSSCRAKGHHFYANLAERVVDGTPCVDPGADTPAICVQGVCKEVGCDDIVGSSWRRDVCGVCKGDNSTCRGISGIFTRLDLSRGTNKIVTIPQGATQVNVSELRPSINHLVLQSVEGEFLLNNVIGRSLSGDYSIGGTVFAYARGTVECPGDCLFAKGPTDVPLNLMIVAHGRNRGVMYSFNVPLDVTDDYFRQIITGGYASSSAQETSTTTSDKDTVLSTAKADSDNYFNMSENDDSSEEGEWGDDNESVDNDNSPEENTNPSQVKTGAHSPSDDASDLDDGKKDDEGYTTYEYEDVQDTGNIGVGDLTDDSNSLSIPAYSVVDPNEMGEDSVFHENNVQSENHDPGVATPSRNVDTSTVLSTTDHVNGQSKPAILTNLEDDYDKATPSNQPHSASSFKITRKEKPKFVNGDKQVAGLSALDGDGGESQSSTHSGVDAVDETSHNPDFVKDEGETSGSSADGPSTEHQHWSPTPTSQYHGQHDEKHPDKTDEHDAASKASSNTKESVNEKRQNDGPAESPQQDKESDDTQTSEPAHLLRPQSDSPTHGPVNQREDNRHADRRHYDHGRFRRPNYSQSFTFRHRYHQIIDAQNSANIGDDSGSGHDRRRPSRPATPGEESASDQRSGDHHRSHHHQQQQQQQQQQENQQIRFRQQPRQHPDSHSAQPDREGYEAESREDYMRRLQAHRQALTAGQSVSREEQGRQAEVTAEQTNAKTQAEYEHNRRQEEYRRELLRRRQLYDQQRAAQDAEYQRRLQEHNRRLRERQMEMQRQQQQHQQQQQQEEHAAKQKQQEEHVARQKQQEEHAARQKQQQEHAARQQQQHLHQQQQQEHAARQQHEHRHRHHNHHQHINVRDRQDQHAGQGHDRQDPYTNIQGRQEYDQRRPHITAPVAPSGGIISRIDSSVIRQQPVYPTFTDTTTEKQEYGSSYDDSLAAQEAHRRHQQRIHQQERPAIDLDEQSQARDVDQRKEKHKTQGQGLAVDISGDGATIQAAEPNSTSDFYPSPTSKLSRNDQHLSSTPAPTRDFLTIPQVPQGPTLASREPGIPQYIPDSRYEDRSSLTDLVDSFESEPRTGLDVNLIPNVIDSRPVIGGGSVTSNVIDDASTYEWRVSGLTECTLTCGAGVQQTVVVCLDTHTQAYVTDENCGSVERPRPKAVTCNTRPCPAAWQTGEWSACSASCGPGQQTRVVNCAARVSATLNVTMPDENCQSSPRPEARRQCENHACNSWIIGNWSQCSVQCGEGVRTRSVRCADQAGHDVTHTHCAEPKPDQEQPCELGPCGKGWYYTEWPEQCPAQCGAGTKKRHVTCLGEEGTQLPDTRCDKLSRPTPEQPCRADVPCGGDWFASEWEECNVTCGNGMKQREVICMKSLPGGLLTVVGDENCAEELKPSTEEPCRLPVCAAEWYMTSWSECSQSCGTGHRTREIRCLDPQQEASSDCDLADKPRTREPCNTERCTTPDPRPASTNTPEAQPDSDCSDSFSRCEIVKHARMCRYEYYRKKCCATCNGDT